MLLERGRDMGIRNWSRKSLFAGIITTWHQIAGFPRPLGRAPRGAAQLRARCSCLSMRAGLRLGRIFYGAVLAKFVVLLGALFPDGRVAPVGVEGRLNAPAKLIPLPEEIDVEVHKGFPRPSVRGYACGARR